MDGNSLAIARVDQYSRILADPIESACSEDWPYSTVMRGNTADVGAYAFAANGNPGWTLAPGFKQFPTVSSGEDMGEEMDSQSDMGSVNNVNNVNNGNNGNNANNGNNNQNPDAPDGDSSGSDDGCSVTGRNHAPISGLLMLFLVGLIIRRRT